jgi:hypothetical protein
MYVPFPSDLDREHTCDNRVFQIYCSRSSSLWATEKESFATAEAFHTSPHLQVSAEDRNRSVALKISCQLVGAKGLG